MKTVCVLFGGVSTEHLISQKSAYNIIRGLRKAGYNVCCTGITKMGEWLAFDGEDSAILDGSWEDLASEKSFEKSVIVRGKGVTIKDFLVSVMGCEPDIIFPALHGINCEDGTLQGLLELSGIPYVGCTVLASAAGMNKVHAKQIFKNAGIPQCKHIAVSRSSIKKNMDQVIKKIENKLGYPCFLKPNNGGSSVGTVVAKNAADLSKGLDEVSAYDSTILIEEFVNCREIEAAVMGNENPKVAMLGEVMTAPQIEYYDYKAKYFDPDSSSVCIPADLTAENAARIKRYAKKAYKALGCSGLSRVDFFIDKDDGRIMLNEINTLPGFTPISLFPKAWEASGIGFEELLKKLCSLAVANKEDNARLEIL